MKFQIVQSFKWGEPSIYSSLDVDTWYGVYIIIILPFPNPIIYHIYVHKCVLLLHYAKHDIERPLKSVVLVP